MVCVCVVCVVGVLLYVGFLGVFTKTHCIKVAHNDSDGDLGQVQVLPYTYNDHTHIAHTHQLSFAALQLCSFASQFCCLAVRCALLAVAA